MTQELLERLEAVHAVRQAEIRAEARAGREAFEARQEAWRQRRAAVQFGGAL